MMPLPMVLLKVYICSLMKERASLAMICLTERNRRPRLKSPRAKNHFENIFLEVLLISTASGIVSSIAESSTRLVALPYSAPFSSLNTKSPKPNSLRMYSESCMKRVREYFFRKPTFSSFALSSSSPCEDCMSIGI